VTIKQQQARRNELHTMPTPKLRKVYMSRTGRIMSEVQSMFSDNGRQIMIDAIVRAEYG
jgi:hypothetical protein